MRLKRRDVLLALIGLSLPLVTSSCGGGNSGTSSVGSSGTTTASASGGGQAPDKIRIGYQVIPNGELLAKALGLAKQAFPNSQVQYISFDSGRDVNTAIAANGIDFGLVGSVPASVGIARGLPYNVYFIHDVIGSAEALVAKNGIKQVTDIKGKKIATPFGSTAHFSLQSLLKHENIPESEVKIIDMQPPEIVAAWQRGDIDGAYVWQPNLGKLQKGGGTILITSAELAKQGAVTADLGVVRKEFADKYPDVVKQYVAVLDQAIKTYRNNPEAAAKSLATELNITPEETKSATKELIWLNSTEQKDAKYLGTPDQPGEFAKVLKDAADFVVAQKTITSAPDLVTYQQNIYSKAL